MRKTAAKPIADWEGKLESRLALFGHRNWVVVTDSAYPAQSDPGIETITASGSGIEVIRKVLDAIRACKHIHASAYIDKELGFVEEKDAPGIGEYRKQLATALKGTSVNHIQHEQIIKKLDQSAQVFRVLIIKTSMTIPYTSVFFELDCGYWNAASEALLRAAMLAAKSR
jgi:L-fucose mutarotase/ribose pyranase (RbsD/FucU family)